MLGVAVGCVLPVLAGAALLAGVAVWCWQDDPPPVAPAAAAADTGPLAVLAGISATIPAYTVMNDEQRAACAAVFARARTAQAAQRLSADGYARLLDAWAAMLADNRVSDEEVAFLRRVMDEAEQ